MMLKDLLLEQYSYRHIEPTTKPSTNLKLPTCYELFQPDNCIMNVEAFLVLCSFKTNSIFTLRQAKMKRLLIIIHKFVELMN